MRIAAGNLLAGAILVDKGQALLINCVELYNRKPSINPHHERFGSRFMVSSLPTLSHRYKRISVISKVEDQSKKLIIGTLLVFNALVTSSIILDINLPAEVGAFTFKFNPSNNTQLFLSTRSIESANKAIAHKAKVYALHDINCSLRQVRSRLTSPNTYTFARFHTEWTHYNDSMPYTIFTIADKPNADRNNSGIACARVLSTVANAMRFNEGNIDKTDIVDIMAGVKESAAKAAMTGLVNLFEDKNKMNIIGNQEVESLLMNLAEICIRELKVANKNIKTCITVHMNDL